VKQSAKIDAYIDFLKHYNETTNIYSRKAYDRLPFHSEDSVNIANIIGDTASVILDIGSGSGFPSIVIAIQNTKNKVFGVESKLKKAAFLSMAKNKLQLKNYHVVRSDILEYARAPFFVAADFITAKAFAPLGDVISLVSQFAKKKQTLIVPISVNQISQIPKLKNGERVIQKDPFFYFTKTF